MSDLVGLRGDICKENLKKMIKKASKQLDYKIVEKIIEVIDLLITDVCGLFSWTQHGIDLIILKLLILSKL